MGARLPARIALPVCLAVLLPAAACTPIEEPWVQDAQQLKTERRRDEAAQKGLRDRIFATQTDR